MKEKLNQFKAEFAKEIFKKADEGAISKEVALDLLTVYDLLPVAPWIELPAFLESYDYFDRYSTIKYMNYLDIADFKVADDIRRTGRASGQRPRTVDAGTAVKDFPAHGIAAP